MWRVWNQYFLRYSKGTLEDGNATVIVVTEECFEKDINLMISKLESENKIKITNKIRVM